MTEQENIVVTPAGDTTEEDVTLSKKEHAELVENLANRTQDKKNLTDEIKELREKKVAAEDEAERLRLQEEARATETPSSTELTPENVAELAAKTVAEALRNKDESDAKTNRQSALSQFKATHKEFHEDNDEAGLKMSAFNRKLERINVSGLQTTRDFLAAFEDAYTLMPKEDRVPEETTVPQPTSSETPVSTPEVAQTTLTSKEEKIIKDSFDGDKERYLKIKAKRPDYVDELLRYAR